MKDENIVAIVAILALALVEIVALIRGLDGQLFLTSIGAIFGIVGYSFGRRKK